MGEGLYNLLGYGVFNPPTVVDTEGYSDFPEKAQNLIYFDMENKYNLRSSYECEPEFLCVGLAIDNELLQNICNPKALPTNILRCSPRKARYLEANIEYKISSKAKITWVKLQKIFKKAGLDLPDARLIVINDWD